MRETSKTLHTRTLNHSRDLSIATIRVVLTFLDLYLLLICDR